MRRARDFYATPTWATDVLISQAPELTRASVLECCSGDGAIAEPLAAAGAKVTTNDISPGMPSRFREDARDPAAWRVFPGSGWVVTNPPFSDGFAILQRAHAHARSGVAFLLRLSFLEPTEERGPWLAKHPPDELIVLPRISFTGDGGMDSVTTAWFVWRKPGSLVKRIVIIPKPKQASNAPALFDEAEALAE